MTPPRRSEQKLATRAQIRDAARARFVEVGYEGTTIRDVARAAGVSVGSVHVHFKDKRALLFACFYEGIRGAVAEIWATIDRDAPLLDQLARCGRVLYRAYAEHPELSRVMFRESLFPAPGEDDDNLEPFLVGVAELHRAALARGELERLPQGGMLAARAFFAVYIAVLIAGLSGHLGPCDDADAAAERWAAELRDLVELQLRGLGLRTS
ncbi:MAG: TetR/AcrR family transcriptional regulator [Myxococcales bacterium]|nr:TetR/AcrR family transcriptional regulator [Myxococcales bacterium]